MSSTRPLLPARRSPVARDGAARTAIGLLAIVLATSLAACEPSEAEGTPSGRASAGLVVLAGEPGAASLTAHDARGNGLAVELPTPATAWISANGEGSLVATLDDGSLRVSQAVVDGRTPAWERAPGPDVELPPEPLYFATWSPNGRRIAAIASDFRPGSQLTIVLVDPVGDASLLLPVGERPLVAPPAWIGDDVVLAQTDRGFVLVDTGTGDVSAGPSMDVGAGVSTAVAPDGSLVAIGAPEGGAVDVAELDRWRAGDAGPAAARLEAEGEVGGLAFDRTAERLAVVWQEPDAPGILAIYRRADGWRAVERFSLPGESARAVVDWLPPAP